MAHLVELSNLHHVETNRSQPRALPRDAHAIRRILVCIDHSPFSEECLGHAVAISKSLGSAITLLHVMQPPHERSGLHATDVLDWEISRQEASAYLEQLGGAGDASVGTASRYQARARPPGRAHHGRRARDRRRPHRAREPRRARRSGVDPGEHRAAGPGGHAWLGAHRALDIERGRARCLRSASSCRSTAPSGPRACCPPPCELRSANDAELLLVFVVREPAPTAVLRAPEDLELARELATRLEVGGKRYLEGLRDQLAKRGGIRAHARPSKRGREAGAPRALAEGTERSRRALRARLHLQPGADASGASRPTSSRTRPFLSSSSRICATPS